MLPQHPGLQTPMDAIDLIPLREPFILGGCAPCLPRRLDSIDSDGRRMGGQTGGGRTDRPDELAGRRTGDLAIDRLLSKVTFIAKRIDVVFLLYKTCRSVQSEEQQQVYRWGRKIEKRRPNASVVGKQTKLPLAGP